MLTQNLRIGLTISALTATSLLFNNMDFFKWDTMMLTPLEAVNETHRASHAKELLGANYEFSDASKVAGSARLNEHIHDKVLKGLPPQWKDQARAISRTLILESERYAMDPVLLLAVIRTESRFNPTIRGGHGGKSALCKSNLIPLSGLPKSLTSNFQVKSPFLIQFRISNTVRLI